MHDYTECDATDLAGRVGRGEVSPLELIDVAIAAIERVNPELNAVVHRMYDKARAQASDTLPDGAFRGVPMVVKDFDGFVAGEPFTASCRFLDGFVPDHDSEAIARLRRSGLVFLAKTNCPELAVLGTTEPRWRGPTRNPWSLRHSAGGSSGGSGALVAARAVPLGHGGDGGGSLRIPGSHLGLVGFKASRGRVPLGPDLGEGWGGYVQWGALTRSVRDAAAMLDVMGGPMPGDPYAAPPLPRPLTQEVSADPGRLRVAFYDGSLFGHEMHRDNVRAVVETATRLEALGHHVESACPEFDRHSLVQAYVTQLVVGIAGEIEDFEQLQGRTAHAEEFEPGTWFLKQAGHATNALKLAHARDAAQAAGRVLGIFHERFDVFLSATTACPPVKIGDTALNLGERAGLAVLRKAPAAPILRKVLETLAESFLEWTPNTQLFNQTGQPAVSLPLHENADGMPIGVQLSAALGREDLLTGVAGQLESAHPWTQRRPKVLA